MSTLSPDFAQRLRRSNVLASLMGRIGDTIRLSEATLIPILDLIIRLWLAQIFWRSGFLKLTHWDTALMLAAHEYPVSWMDPTLAAYTGAAIELICPLFLALGLGTRLAAVPLLALALVIQIEYRQLNEHLFWALLFGWYVVMGPGALSLDRLLGRGFYDSAIPLARPLNRLFALLTRRLGPLYRLFLRGWMAMFIAAAAIPGDFAAASLLQYLCPLLLAIGLMTRVAALAAALLAVLMTFTGSPDAMLRAELPYWLFVLGLIAFRGPGLLSLDYLTVRYLRRLFPQLDGKPATTLEGLPHVVIVGAGFGGLRAARELRLTACRVTLIDSHNYHLFQPLLYQVATAVLSPADIAEPIRGLFRDQFNARVLMGRVSGVDTRNQEVIMGQRRLPYDYLVLATGARHSYFGNDEWEPYAPGLKRVDDATDVRRRILLAFEKAEDIDDPAEQKRLMTFVIVGGGPTGVELAGAIAELAHHGMKGEFRKINPADARVILVQSGPRLLPAFPETLSAITARSLKRLGVEVLTDSRVKKVDADGVIVGEERIEARTAFWAAGVIASPAARWLGAEADSAGRVKVGPDLSVPGLSNVFAIGDTALSNAWNGQPVPGLAPAAKQGGAYVARLIRARLEGRKPPGPFRYRHQGSLATIGRRSAVIDFGWIRLSGAFAWWLWGLAHVFFLAGMRSRTSVAMEWFWAYLTFRRGTRLITGVQESE